MKKSVVLSAILCLFMMLSGCKETMSLDVTYGETQVINSEKLSKYENLSWTSNDNTVAEVNEKNEIIGKAPGTAVLTASNNDKIVAEYTVNVSIIPATDIVLSTNSTELVVDDEFQLNYTLFPDNASNYGIKWKSADENVAVVHEDGSVLAVSPGQTTISASNESGIMAACSVTVKEKSAYDRLSDEDKSFVDCALKNLNSFKNPDSVIIKEIGKLDTWWTVHISAMNGFGGMNSEVYYLDKELGFWNWKALGEDRDVLIIPKDSYNIELINEAINEKR